MYKIPLVIGALVLLAFPVFAVNKPILKHMPMAIRGNNTFAGAIASISGSNFTIQAKNKSQIVNTSTSTIYRTLGKTVSFSDLAVGKKVAVKGTLSSNILNADIVNIVSPAIRLKGTVETISGNTITVKSSSITYTVDLTNSNILYKNGHKADISIIKVNDSVVIVGIQSLSNNISSKILMDTSQKYTK